MGGWLLTPFLQKIGRSEQAHLRERVLKSLKTAFTSHYTKTVSLTEALDLANIAVYGKRATGEKYLNQSQQGLPGHRSRTGPIRFIPYAPAGAVSSFAKSSSTLAPFGSLKKTCQIPAAYPPSGTRRRSYLISRALSLAMYPASPVAV